MSAASACLGGAGAPALGRKARIGLVPTIPRVPTTGQIVRYKNPDTSCAIDIFKPTLLSIKLSAAQSLISRREIAKTREIRTAYIFISNKPMRYYLKKSGGLSESRIMSDRLVSVEEISEYLGVSKDTVYGWIAKNEMPIHKAGKL